MKDTKIPLSLLGKQIPTALSNMEQTNLLGTGGLQTPPATLSFAVPPNSPILLTSPSVTFPLPALGGRLLNTRPFADAPKVISTEYISFLSSVSPPMTTLDLELGTSRFDLESTIASLRRDLITKTNELRASATELKQNKQSTMSHEAELRLWKEKHEELNLKLDLRQLLDRVCPEAQKKLLEDAEFSKLFENDGPSEAFIMSIDIRRSTELMLKAQEPKRFAEFITRLADQLREVILRNYGMFDKFTGDGILAFFPEFYSGSDFGLLAAIAASKCHEVFQKHYKENRGCFSTVMKDVGLGIGVDFGHVHLVKVGGELTVVGAPVVYACRMAGARPHQTLLNQPAYECLLNKHAAFCGFDETEIEIKHEGRMVAYSLVLNERVPSPSKPTWSTSPVTETEGLENDKPSVSDVHMQEVASTSNHKNADSSEKNN